MLPSSRDMPETEEQWKSKWPLAQPTGENVIWFALLTYTYQKRLCMWFTVPFAHSLPKPQRQDMYMSTHFMGSQSAWNYQQSKPPPCIARPGDLNFWTPPDRKNGWRLAIHTYTHAAGIRGFQADLSPVRWISFTGQFIMPAWQTGFNEKKRAKLGLPKGKICSHCIIIKVYLTELPWSSFGDGNGPRRNLCIFLRPRFPRKNMLFLLMSCGTLSARLSIRKVIRRKQDYQLPYHPQYGDFPKLRELLYPISGSVTFHTQSKQWTNGNLQRKADHRTGSLTTPRLISVSGHT